jgi:coatomer subunit beta
MDFLTSEDNSAVSVVQFIREILHAYPDMRGEILTRLTEILPTIRSAPVAEVVLWVLGEYCEVNDVILNAFKSIRASVGPLPISKSRPGQLVHSADKVEDSQEDDDKTANTASTVSGPVVLADGSYASQTATEEGETDISNASNSEETFRRLLLSGNHFLATALSFALTKLSLRVAAQLGDAHNATKMMIVDSLLIICGCLEYGQKCQSDKGSSIAGMSGDHQERLTACINVLLDPSALQLRQLFLSAARGAYDKFLEKKSEEKNEEVEAEDFHLVEPDHIINFRQLRPHAKLGSAEIDLDDDADISKAAGASVTGGNNTTGDGPIRRVHQLTGFTDMIYAEASVTVHDYDIVLEILLMNRTSHVLTNVCIELAAVGDLKIVDRPQACSLAPGGSQNIKTSIKVSSTETGHVFGNIVFEVHGSQEVSVININDIHIDIMDYIKPSTCPEADFRLMWAEFEWENKVAVDTNMVDLQAYLSHIMTVTNMTCLTPMDFLDEGCQFLAANLYARSVFGEDALVNVSIAKSDDASAAAKITGYIRIRSKTQGIALSLGNRINANQRIERLDESKGDQVANR